jgi:hypothetical protein
VPCGNNANVVTGGRGVVVWRRQSDLSVRPHALLLLLL